MLCAVEMFKVRMQGQYGSKDDKRLRVVVREMWTNYGFRNGIMRGYWVISELLVRQNESLTHYDISGNFRERNSGLCWVSKITRRSALVVAIYLAI